MQTWAFRLDKRQHVVVAAMNAVHENDEIVGAIGHSQAQDLGEKINRLRHLVGKQKSMRQASGLHLVNARACGRIAFSNWRFGNQLRR